MKIRMILVAFMLVLMFVGTASAQNRGARAGNLSLGIGGLFPQGDVKGADFNTSYQGAIMYEYFGNKNVGVGVDFIFSTMDSDTFVRSHTISGSTGDYETKYDVTNYGLIISALTRYNRSFYDMYAGAGVGYIFTGSEMVVSTPSGTVKKEEDNFNYCLQLTLGFRAYVSNNLNIGVVAKYLIFENDLAEAKNVDLNGLSIMATFGFSF